MSTATGWERSLTYHACSIDNQNPTDSGIRNLPLIIAVTLAVIVSSSSVTVTGIATPLLIAGSIVATIGAGFLYTLDIGTGSPKWIGYQVLAGLGWGTGFQIPIIVGQGTADPVDVAPVTAIIVCFQTVGAAFFLAAAQAGFVNQILVTLPQTAPGVPPASVIATGATALREVFGPEQIHGVLSAYMAGIKATFAIAIAGAGLSFFIALMSSFKKLPTHTIAAA